MAYDDSLCLRAKLIKVEKKDTTDQINEFKSMLVSDLLDEIRDYGLRPLFSTRQEQIDVLLYKFRVILFELIENAIEHAFIDQFNSHLGTYIGIYARVRKKAEPDFESKWEQARRNEIKNCPTVSRFEVTPQSDWVELFYYDSGRGLLADLASWGEHVKSSGNNGLADLILKLKPTSNKLHEISKYMFKDRLSRFERKGRTAVTGLQHIGLVLSDARDFARLCVAREWVGGIHPWKDNIHSGPINLAKRNEYADLSDTLGTAWHFCINIRIEEVKPPGHWSVLKDSERKQYVNNPSLEPLKKENAPNWQIFDERELPGIPSHVDLHSIKISFDTVVWLPGDSRKERVYQWLNALKDIPKVKNWIIADIPLYKAITVSEVLKWEKLRPGLTIYLVTDDWKCVHLSSQVELPGFGFNDEAQDFLKDNINIIFRTLRAHDSHLFWKDIPNSVSPNKYREIPFVYEPVLWEGSDNVKAKLYGYLELTQALTDPLRAEVCKRAIKRTWHLFSTGKSCEPADALLAGLLPEGSINRSPPSIGPSNEVTNVSSVLVTGSTSIKNRKRGIMTTIHLFRHDYVNFEVGIASSREEPVALDWMPSQPVLSSPPPGKLMYERIPGTPFIGRGGPKAIPIRRFDKPQKKFEGVFEVFSDSFYGEPPNEMYAHFSRLKILKLGHWSYEGHHDLFSLNLNKAYTLEKIDTGPLVNWLISQFNSLSNKGVRVLIYPSHKVTDLIVRDILTNYPDCLPLHVIPVHFLGQHSQSSIRIPSLTYDRIREILSVEKAEGGECSVVLFDDGTITGKVAREMEHLIKNAGAKKVYTLMIVNRTGLPLYRKIITSIKDRRIFYWRWDMPALGSGRTCPLCRAIEQAQLISTTMPKGEAKNRISKWISIWELKDVVHDWEEHGLPPISLPSVRKMTFGKEWLPDGTIEHYEVDHKTTTGIASMVAELMRTTTYKAVGLKIADEPAGSSYLSEDGTYHEPLSERQVWDRARVEVLVGQVLLFFDDFDKYELFERLNRIFEILISRTESSEIHVLASLTLLLSDKESAGSIFRHNFRKLCESRITLPDGELALGYLLAKSNVDWMSLRDKEELSVDERATLTENLTYAWYLFAERKSDPVSTFRMNLLTMVLLLGDTPSTMHCGFLRRRTADPEKANTERVLSNLLTLKNTLHQINPLLYEHDIENVFYPDGEAANLDKKYNELESLCKSKNTDLTIDYVSTLHKNLFGIEGLAQRFQKGSLMSVKELKSYLKLEGRYDEICEEWKNEILDKGRDKPSIIRRWKSGEMFLLPEVDVFSPEGMDSVMLVTPPVVCKVIWDNMKNVIHSPGCLSNNNDDVITDLNVEIVSKDDDFFVELTMRTKNSGSIPRRKKNEELLLSVFDCKVAHNVYKEGDFWIQRTTIPIVSVSSLGRVTL